jgi:hypothetical protein
MFLVVGRPNAVEVPFGGGPERGEVAARLGKAQFIVRPTPDCPSIVVVLAILFPTTHGSDLAHAATEMTVVRDGTVSFLHHYSFRDGEALLSAATLRFRTEEEIRSSLDNAGFNVEHIFGGWNREPVGAGDGEFLVISRTWLRRWSGLCGAFFGDQRPTFRRAICIRQKPTGYSGY